ncbi:eIF-2-alpha kinase activator GCN1 [Balamuthia mandrillaris]
MEKEKEVEGSTSASSQQNKRAKQRETRRLQRRLSEENRLPAFPKEEEELEEETDFDRKLALLERHVASSSLNRRLWLWRKALPKLLAGTSVASPVKEIVGEAKNENVTTKLAAMFWRTLERYADRLSQLAVEELLVWLLHSESETSWQSFVLPFVNCLLGKINAFVSHSAALQITEQKSLALLRWSNFIAQEPRYFQFVKSKKFSVLAKVQFQLLHLVSHVHSNYPRNAAFAQFSKVFHLYPDAYDEYFKALEKPSRSDCAAIGQLLHFAAKTEELLQQHRTKYLDWYIALIFSERTAPTRRQHSFFLPLLQKLTDEEFASQLSPVIDRYMKRNPEAIIEDLAYLIQHISLDISAYAVASPGGKAAKGASFFDMISPHLRSVNESIRHSAVHAIGALAKECKQPDALLQLATGVSNLVKTESDPKNRANIVDALKAVYENTLAVSNRDALANVVCETLVVQLAKEASDDVKLKALECLGLWLSCAPAFPEKAKDLCLKGFKETKDAIRFAFLSCIAHASQYGNQKMVTQASNALADTLITKTEAAIKEKKFRKDLAYTLTILAFFAANDAATGDKLEKKNFWKSFFSASSTTTKFFFSHYFLKDLAEPELLSLVGLTKALVSQYWHVITNPGSSSKLTNGLVVQEVAPFFSVVIYLLVCRSWKVRKEGRTTLQQLHKEQPDLMQQLLPTFYAFLKAQGSSTAQADSATTDLFLELDMEPELRSRVLIEALHACLPFDSANLSQIDADAILPWVLVEAHHPYIFPHHQWTNWQDCLHRLRLSLHEDDEEEEEEEKGKEKEKEREQEERPQKPISDEVLDSIIRYFFEDNEQVGKEGILSPNKLIAEASANGLSSVVREKPFSLTSIISQIKRQLAKNETLERVSKAQEDIYKTPADMLWEPKSDVYVPQVRENKNIRVLKGQRMYKDADEQWEAQVRKELEEKKLKEQGGPKMTKAEIAARDAKLKEQATVRGRIAGMIHDITSTLQAISVFSYRIPTELHSEVATLFTFLKPLLAGRFKEVREQAERTLQDLARCMRVIPTLESLTLEAQTTSEAANEGAEEQEEQKACPEFSRLLSLRICYALVYLFQSGNLGKDFLIPALPGQEISEEETGLVSALTSVISYMHSFVAELPKHQRLSSAAMCFYLPILEAALVREDVFALEAQGQAMTILQKHRNAPIPPAPFSDMFIRGLTHQMQVSAKFRPAAHECLLDFAKHLETNQLNALLEGLLYPEAHIRLSCLQALRNVSAISEAELDESAQDNPYLQARMWHSTRDEAGENSQLANQLWESSGLRLHSNDAAVWDHLIRVLAAKAENVRRQAARAVAAAIEQFPAMASQIFSKLFALYKENVPPPPQDDRMHPALAQGRLPTTLEDIMKEEPKQEVKVYSADMRSGVCLALGACAHVVEQKTIPSIFRFLIAEPLADEDELVRDHATQAGMSIIAEQGKEYLSLLLPILEGYLDKPDVENSYRGDLIRESVVIFMGTLARHLDPEGAKEKIYDVVNRLNAVLKTPSEPVQKAVSQCLTFLMKNIKDEEERKRIVESLLERLGKGASYGERKGAAFGLAGVVKGIGVPSLKQYNIVTKLTTMVENKKHANTRQGALFAFETLTNVLKLSFEPYVIRILPKLLSAFSDNSPEVRDATYDTARCIMGNLSGHGVKFVLPPLLKALDDRSQSWRTKMASVELLGTMAFCNPKQLSSCLPTIVPKLSTVLTDTHAKVVEAARTALDNIGSVIQNPEIQGLIPILLQAIYNPDTGTIPALDALLGTSFIHVIDVPSLALVMPVLTRGLSDRKTEVKKKSAQIVGNMCSLTEQKDLIPYLEVLVPNLKAIVCDPIPDVRAVAAKALGTLVQGIGEEHFKDLIPWLLQTMESDAGTVERSGAAQALSEVLAGSDESKFDELMPSIQKGIDDARPHVREGFISLFVYLPGALGEQFESYLGEVLPAILQGLADETEMVRDVAMRAGQSIVTQYATEALDIMLPSLLDGLFHINWRIRQSSVMLLGDLLFHIMSKGEEGSTKVLSRALTKKQRGQILSRLYMLRADSTQTVRQRALMVWKTVVDNTPATLRQIIPELMQNIIQSLGNTNTERRQLAGKTLGDLVGKLGDRVLPEIIPTLEKGLATGDANTRQGVCLGLSEVTASATPTDLVNYLPILLPSVQKALCDELEEVREAAAKAFDRLYSSVGGRAIDEILPGLINALENDELSDYALDGLRQILTLRAQIILPFLLPKLTRPPITPFNAKALSSLAEVSGSALYQHLSLVLPALLNAMSGAGLENLSEPEQEAAKAEALHSAKQVCLCVKKDGMHLLFSDLNKLATDPQESYRSGAAELIGSYCAESGQDIASFIPIEIKTLLTMMNDPSVEVQTSAAEALGKLTNSIDKKVQPNHVEDIRKYLGYVEEDLRKEGKDYLPGFCLKKGLDSVLPILLQGLMYGSADVRASSASALGDVILLTSMDALKPYVVKITGPLIRIVADRFPGNVKSAILKTLSLLLTRGGVMLKPFLPQLQTTFVRALNDSSAEVRDEAASALGKLMGMHTRVDPLVTDLLAGISENKGGVQLATLKALQSVLLSAGDKINESVLNKAGITLLDLLGDEEENVRDVVARSLAAYGKYTTDSLFENLVRTELSLEGVLEWKLRHSYILTVLYLIRYAFDRLVANEELYHLINAQVRVCLREDKVNIKRTALECSAKLILRSGKHEGQHSPIFRAAVEEYMPLLAKASGDPINEVKSTSINAIKRVAKAFPETMSTLVSLVIPPLMIRVKDRSSLPVKLAAERALLHVLRIPAGEKESAELVQSYVSGGVDKKEAKELTDYIKRVLTKLPVASDQEESDEELL